MLNIVVKFNVSRETLLNHYFVFNVSRETLNYKINAKKN